MAGPEVWFAIPSANPVMAARTLPEWRRRGYRVAVLQDRYRFDVDADIVDRPWDKFVGWSKSVNRLALEVVPRSADIVVTGGDDMLPEPHMTAQQIADLVLARFPDGFGVMQPTGDTMDGTDRICGSPWMTRRFFETVNGGLGPFWHGYFSFYADEEMLCVTRALDCIWQNPRITQYHDHWTRRGLPARPRYLSESYRRWNEDQQMFFTRRMCGFPGAEPAWMLPDEIDRRMRREARGAEEVMP